MKKAKQIIAVIGIIALVLLYASTLVAAILDSTSTMRYLTASIGATIIIPVFIWVIEIFLRIAPKNEPEEELFTDSSSSEDDNSN
ncbi:hypothetical protein SAMN02910453_0100 [Lachnospiraceae bacterium A10]|jgi:uncharacterized membrane protein|nr:hypothetical protein SAMN02910453_0100 [Lachnospiraceae bacterium A10]